jgi:predicted oxidoreductase
MNSFNNSSSEFHGFSKTALGFWRLHTWSLTGNNLLDFIKQSMEAGINTFDHADIYGNYSCEELFGQAMAGQSALRTRMQLVSKCGIKLVSDKRPDHKVKTYDTSKAHIIKSVENSLLRESGKVLNFGLSNFLPHQLDLLQSRIEFPLITNQVEISVMCLDSFSNGVLDQCQHYRIQTMAWSPLAGGRLFHSDDPQATRLRTVLTEIAAQHENAGIEQIALAWLLNHPSGIVPVIGTGNINRVKNAVEAEQIQLTPEQWFSIYIASVGSDLP